MPSFLEKIQQISVGGTGIDWGGIWMNRGNLGSFAIDPQIIYSLVAQSADEVNRSVEETLGLESGSVTADNLGEYLGALNSQYPGSLGPILSQITGASNVQIAVALYDWALGQASQHLGLNETPTYGSPNYQDVVAEAAAILNGQITPAGQNWLNNNQPQGPSQKEITRGGDAVYDKNGNLISITYDGVRYVPDPQTGQLLPDYRDEPDNIQYGGETTFEVDITNLPAGGIDQTTTDETNTTSDETTMEDYTVVRIGDRLYRIYSDGRVEFEPNMNSPYEAEFGNLGEAIESLGRTPPFVDDGQGQSQSDGVDTLTNFILSLLGLGGGGSMSQDQVQAIQTTLQDLVDVTIGPQTQATDVDIGPQSQTTTTDVDIGETDIDLTPTQTTTIEEGAIQNAPVFTDAVSVSDLISEGAFDVGGGQARVGNVTTGPSTATVGNIDAGDSAATIEEGAVSISDLISSPIFAEGAFDINDLISEGAITISDLFDQGAVQAAGGAGGAGGTGGSVGNIDVGDSTATIEQGALSNVFEEGAVQAGAGGAATIEQGAIQNMPVFTDAVSVSDIISEGAFSDLIGQGAFSDLIGQGAFSDLISEGALSAAGGAGGAGGTATSTIAPGAVSNVVDTSGIGQAVTSLGDTLGGFGGDVLDFLGNFLGGQQSTEGQVSENTLAGILAQEAANRYIADKAAESQQNILDFQKKQYDDAIARLQPFYDMGVTQAQEVLPEYIDAAKRDIEYVDIDPFDADDPALRFLQDEARRAIENSAAARGRLNTGGTLTDLQDRSANIALARAGELVGIRDRMNQEERLRDEYDFNKLGRLVGGAQNAYDDGF